GGARGGGTVATIAAGRATQPTTANGPKSDRTRPGTPVGTSLSSWSAYTMWSLNKLLGWVADKPPRLVCKRATWDAGVAELRLRTRRSTRESGAFLLGTESPGSKRIEKFVFYDDLDPNALSTGIVHFDGAKFP